MWIELNNLYLEPVKDGEDHMTFREFVQNCDDGGFINYDGFGHLAFEHQRTNIVIRPSHTAEGHDELRKIAEAFGYVVWYNR